MFILVILFLNFNLNFPILISLQTKTSRDRVPTISAEDYSLILDLLSRDKPLPVKERSSSVMKAYKKMSHFKMEKRTVHDPYRGKKLQRIVVNGKIVLPSNELSDCIKSFYSSTSGDGAKKLQDRIASHYFGVGETTIQGVLNSMDMHRQRQVRFNNAAPLRPVDASNIMERHQVDIVDLRTIAVTIRSIKYQYVLSVLDVFSRFLWLRPLPDKTAETVALELYKIYLEFGPPRIVQTDQGGEFKGAFQRLCKLLKTKLIHSSSNHPQSQGKDERSHRTWKEKIRLDLFALKKNKQCDWVTSLPLLQQTYNEGKHRITGQSPYKLLFGITSNHVKHLLTTEDNSEDLDTETAPWIDTENINIDEDKVNEHVAILHTLRKSAFLKSSCESSKMVNRRLAKFPPSQYHNGDEVYIKFYGKDSRVKRGGKCIKAPRVFEGVICQSDASNYRYKVEFINHVGKKTKEWIKVNDITSRSYEKEKKKKTKARSLISPKTKESRKQSPVSLMESYEQMQKNILETIQLKRTEENRQSTLLRNAQRMSLEFHSDNQGGGNCMFYALSHQLLTYGIDLNYQQIRHRIVEFLRTNPSLQLSNGVTVNFENFIHHRNGWNSYLTELSMDGTWGDYLTLMAAANIFHMRITVVSSILDAPPTIIEPVESSDNINIYLGHLHEFHYISLIPMAETSSLELCPSCGLTSPSHTTHTCEMNEHIKYTETTNDADVLETDKFLNDENHKSGLNINENCISRNDLNNNNIANGPINHEQNQRDTEIDISCVIEEMKKQIDAQNINDESPEFNNSANCLIQNRHKGVPLAINNARVHMFLRAMKTEGREYQIIHTAWGQFAFIPEEDMDIFETQRSVYMPSGRSYRLFNTSFRYWLFNIYEGNALHVDTSNGTVAEMDEDIANAYDTWADNLMLNLRLNL